MDTGAGTDTVGTDTVDMDTMDSSSPAEEDVAAVVTRQTGNSHAPMNSQCDDTSELYIL